MHLFLCLMIPFLGTMLGSACVFLMKDKINSKLEKLLLGFASGVMLAASIWSLLIPSIELSEQRNLIAWLPASIGFLFGMIFLLILDSLIPHLHVKSNSTEGLKSKFKRTTMMILAVTLHNIPEGIVQSRMYHKYCYNA